MKKVILFFLIIVVSVSSVFAEKKEKYISIGASYNYIQYYGMAEVFALALWANSRIGINIRSDYYINEKISFGIDTGVLTNLWAIIDIPIMAHVSYRFNKKIFS